VKKVLAEGSQGVAIMQQAEKSYLLALHHVEVVKHKWGRSTHTTVAEVQAKIVALLKEYVESGDKAEACHCKHAIFHHEVVKKALVLVMEENVAEAKIWALLQETADEGLITSSQMAKDFTRLSDSIHDLALDIPDANKMLKVFTTRSISQHNWMGFFKFIVSIAEDFRNNLEKKIMISFLHLPSLDDDMCLFFVFTLYRAVDDDWMSAPFSRTVNFRVAEFHLRI
jgi:hypothetical protein